MTPPGIKKDHNQRSRRQASQGKAPKHLTIDHARGLKSSERGRLSEGCKAQVRGNGSERRDSKAQHEHGGHERAPAHTSEAHERSREGTNKHQREGFHGEPPRGLLRICRILHNLVFV